MMPGGSDVQVLYFVPEDGDVEKHPNVFSVAEKTGKGVRLADVKSAFPLPGAYHFRFKRAFKNTYVWFDVSNDADVVPAHEGFIMTKVSRICERSRGPVSPIPSRKTRINSTTSDKGKKLENRSSDDLLGLNGVSVDSIKMTDVEQSNVMDLDWVHASSAPVTSSTPPVRAPPQVSSQPANLIRASTPPATTLTPSSQPMQASAFLQPQRGQQTQQRSAAARTMELPDDLSSAAKDFKL